MSHGVRIPILETALGGLVPGRSYLAHGDEGVGKSVLGLQVAHAWIRAGRRVLFLTHDRSEDVLEQASLLGLSLERAWRGGALQLLCYTPEADEQVRALGMKAFLDRLHEAGQAAGARALVCDTLSPIFAAASRRVQFARDTTLLVDALRAWEWSALLLARTESLRRRAGLRDALREQCWGALELCRFRDNRSCDENTFFLRVERARQRTPAGQRVPYTIALEVGLMPIPQEATSGSDASPPRARPRLLIAARRSIELEQLGALLRPSLDVALVEEGGEALARAVAWRPDVVLLERDLPEVSGYAVTRALRQGRYTMPLLLLAGGGRRRSDRVRALLNGASDFVQRPFDVREVATRIRVASRMRVQPLVDGSEEQLLERLEAKSRSERLELPEFFEALSVAIRGAARFSSPVSLVTFQFQGNAEDESAWGAWQLFQRTLRSGTRVGDLTCQPTATRLATLLCHESQEGVDAFTARMEELARAALEEQGAAQGAWSILTAGVTLETPGASRIDLPDLLQAAFALPRTLLGPRVAGDGAVEKTPTILAEVTEVALRSDGPRLRTGTDNC